MNKIMIIGILLLFVSCSSTPDEDEYRKGSEGIRMNVMSDATPDRIYEGSNMDLILEFRNKGAYDKPYGKIVLYGFDRSILPLESKDSAVTDSDTLETPLPELSARSKYNPVGGYDTEAYHAKDGKIKLPYSKNIETEIAITNCYHYQTRAYPTVCVHTGTGSTNPSCRPTTINMKDQGAPVAIKSVKEEILGGKLNFVIEIEHKGKGTVIAPGKAAYNRCPFELTDADRDHVDVSLGLTDIGEATCVPSGRVKLIDDEGTIHCTFDVENSGSGYTTQMDITLDYHYMDKISHDLEIIDVP